MGMKSILLVMMFLSVSAFAGEINRIECSAAPNWVHFELRLDYNTGAFHGSGIENYANLEFNCERTSNLKTIVCASLSPFSQEAVSAIITIDKDNIFTAKFNGIYSTHRNLKMGCIAGM
jgi:hypothetical protein